MWEDLVQIDRDIFVFINSLWIGEFDGFWLFVTQIENWIPLYLFIFFLLFKKLSRPTNYIAITSVFAIAYITLFLTNVVKNYVERLRPNNEPLLMDSIRIMQTPENFSFWSGHSAVSFAVATFCAILLFPKMKNGNYPDISGKWIFLLYLWPITFAFSRIFVGVHYPFDVTVGMIVGLILGTIIAVAFTRITDRLFHSA